ncbi:MAG: flagellin [Thiomicrorhabdus sp.]|nr:MAG: flagellin [Thiomicrorhabdus sp.]
MAMVINTNMASLNAVRLLESTTREQSLAMEKLTSGKAINRAADNAAGLAVVTGMTVQIRGTEQAIQNANDGISVVQTVDGATDEVINMLQRMRELSVQSLNGTYSSSNRDQMDAEYSQLELEIDRVATTTKFNEIPLMANFSTDGTQISGIPTPVNLHIGWDVGDDNKVNISVANFGINISGAGGVLGQYTNITGSVIAGQFEANDITTQATASVAIQHVDGAMSQIISQRAKWGAMQNRLESTVNNLSNVNENVMAARSRIEDTDFARESANLARTQVLQQAGMSMLSQANQQSQQVLNLLQ